MPTAARTHQSRERVFVVGLVTGEISSTVSGPGGRNRLHRLSASAAGLCQALRRGYLFRGLTVVLTDDIDADGAAVSIPIFLGDFDGRGHKITGLRLTESCSEYGLFSRVESGASVRNLTVEGEVIPAGTQTDVGGIVGQMVADITLRFSSGGLDELQTELNALQSLINRTLDDAQPASDSVTRIAACADAAQNSAAGPAAPDTAQLRADIGALQAADSVPEELLHLTLRFAARGKVLKRQTFGYGDSFTEDGRPALLAEGLFRTGDTLQAVQADTADAPRGADGVWTLTLPVDGEESHTIRWRVPADGAKRYTVYTAADGGWKKAQTSTVGSYLCCALPSDSAQFAVVPAMHAAWQLWATIAAALTAIAAVITLVIRKRRAKAAKRAQ